MEARRQCQIPIHLRQQDLKVEQNQTYRRDQSILIDLRVGQPPNIRTKKMTKQVDRNQEQKHINLIILKSKADLKVGQNLINPIDQ